MPITLSGSLSLTGSIVASGNLTTTGTITAQTLVVQTITSSILNVTGSNIFGSRITDRQTFTGSIYITGSSTTINAGCVILGSNGSPASDFFFNVTTTCVGTNATVAQFYNAEYTAGTRGFIRIRNSANIGATTSAYIGQGQDSKTYIYNNDPSRAGDIVINASGLVGVGIASPTSQLHVCSLYSQTPLIVQGGGNGGVPIACFMSGPNQIAIIDDNANLIIGGCSFATRVTATTSGLLVNGSMGVGNPAPKENFTVGNVFSGNGGLAFCYFQMAQGTWSTFACVTDGDTNVMTDITYVNTGDFNRSGALIARWAYNGTCAGLYIVGCVFNNSQNITTFGVRNNGGALQICITGGGGNYKVQALTQGARATG